jgi:hypothetical protein
MAFIYSTVTQSGIDINNVFYLDAKGAPEYPAPPFLAGELAWGTDGSEWVYATASITITSGSAVIFSPVAGSWSVALLTSTNGRTGFGDLIGIVGGATGSVNVSQPTGTQTASFFWVQRAGIAQRVLTANSLAANVSLGTSAVGGLLGTIVGGTSALVSGIVFSTLNNASGGAVQAVLNYPTSGGPS